MAIQKEIWINDIVEAIYANNKFLEFAEDATSFLINGKFLHIPQAGGATDVEQDLTVFPVDATERTDLDLILPLTNFYVKPVRIAKIDEYELSFSKRNSVMSQNLANLTDRVALKVLFNWAAASGFINVATTGAASPFVRISKTTGAARAAELAGSTGNRKTALRQDIARMAAMLDAQDVPQDGRVALLTPQMYNDLFSDDVMLRRDVTNEADLKAGVINELMGFKIMKRSRVLNINAAYTGAKDMSLKTYTTAAATDNAASLFWHPSMVYKAVGEVDVFERDNDPQFYGSILSSLTRATGIKKRLDNLGVVALVEDTAA